MTWPFITAIIVALFAVGAAVGSRYEAGKASDEALALYESNQKATQRRLDATDAAAAEHEKDKVRSDALFVEIERMVTDVKKSEFYAAGGMCLDAAGLRAVSAGGARNRPPAREPARAVP